MFDPTKGEIASEKTIPLKKRRALPISVSEPPLKILKSSENADICGNNDAHNQSKMIECLTQILDTLKSFEKRIGNLESHFKTLNQAIKKQLNRDKSFVCHRLSVSDKSILKQWSLPIDNTLDLEKTERMLENNDYLQSVVSSNE